MSASDAIALTNMTESQSEILLEKNFNGRQPDFNDFDAVLSCVSKLDIVKKLQFKDYNYMINTYDPIEVAKDIYFELSPQTADETKLGTITKIVYRIYSDVLGIADLKEYIGVCRQEYEAQRNNKLGNETFFFDQITSDNKFSNALSFDKKVFHTDRTFDNVFFEEREEVETRVKHFINNREWYKKRGMPYALGFMFHGAPGTGKTSTIKAIANITHRHIINVRFSGIKTNTQLKNLFYNPVLQVVNPETLNIEKYIVPIHQRLYVIEDIDCMTNIIKRRGLQSEEQEEQDKVVEKPKEVKKPVKKAVQDVIDGDEELQSYWDSAIAGEKAEMAKETAEEDDRDKITLDSILNTFDGTLEIPNRMLCCTTNHLEVIDPALIRPGRIDMIIEFKYCTRVIIKQMFESFYEKTFDINVFSKIKDYKISPASVNQVLFKYFTKPENAIEEIIGICSKRKSYKKREKDDPLTD